jgi:hypothetical protein
MPDVYGEREDQNVCSVLNVTHGLG